MALRGSALRPELDYLFVDEGGQVSLADALAMGTCARNLVLLGDPLQLGQVLRARIRRAASVLEHLLGEATTIPEDRGVFLERTFRLHPDVCRYISDVLRAGSSPTRGQPSGHALRDRRPLPPGGARGPAAGRA